MHDIKAVERFSAKVQSKIHFIDFNNSLIVTGREGNDTIYSANFNRWQSGWYCSPNLCTHSPGSCLPSLMHLLSDASMQMEIRSYLDVLNLPMLSTFGIMRVKNALLKYVVSKSHLIFFRITLISK